jgi:7-cyano-7-deazaguanine synthase
MSLDAIVFAVSRHVMKSAAHERNRQLMAFDNTLAMMKRAVVLLSGGVDSTTTLAVARQRDFETCALTFRYGQRHAVEVDAARRVAQALGAARHEIVAIDLRAFGGSALTADIAVPKDRAAEEIGKGIPSTYVPARNTIFLSYALAWAEVLGANDIFIGVNALDYSGYPDCRPEFVGAYERMANLATKAGVEGRQKLTIHTPLIHLSKAEIIAEGRALGVDFALTLSCYDPTPDGAACGRCDACVLRRKGFVEADVPDPTRYAA